MKTLTLKSHSAAERIPADGSLLPLMEAFYTIQGEGYHAGRAAYFIRLAGCDVGCHWCDVKESWNPQDHPLATVEEIVAEAAAYPAKVVVITGGEPLMYNLQALTRKLHEKGIQTFIETSGAYPLTGEWDWICLSPKKFKAPLESVLPHASELKVVVFNKSDFEWAEKFADKLDPQARLYLQPEWSKAEQMTPLLVEYVKNNPKWQISVQTHKYMNIP
ncbi:MAG TPA: 7-carboxy-7-deazaguanine synthase QueE [Adhaeribacter sp.]|nr:7-carboxy-7-deazaguanine synthase QueE [Adhaeribacter sp.]